MTKEELDDLAHELAEETAKSTIECNTGLIRDSGGHKWHNYTDVDKYGKFAVERSVTYLEAAGILKRSPENASWVSWDEDDIDEVDG